ncbi:hypothetical protein NEIG_01426 [Nematocida sp. ERTm5]|nr:hypothetical protein NEIG_01426 [Nematocida sp. ERTm5]
MTSSRGDISEGIKWIKTMKIWERIIKICETEWKYGNVVEEEEKIYQLYKKVKENEDLMDVWVEITEGQEKEKEVSVLMNRMNQELTRLKDEEVKNNKEAKSKSIILEKKIKENQQSIKIIEELKAVIQRLKERERVWETEEYKRQEWKRNMNISIESFIKDVIRAIRYISSKLYERWRYEEYREYDNKKKKYWL